MPIARVRRRAVLVAVAAVLLAIATARAPARAHAILLASSPAAGEELAQAPHTIALTFDEAVETSLGSLRVLDAGGSAHASGAVMHPGGDPSRIAIRLRGMTVGRYVVAWQVVSADSHVVSGAFAFGVGVAAGSAPVPAGAGATVPLFAVLHFVMLAAALLAIGLPAGVAGIAPATRRAPTALEFAAWIVLAFAAFADLVLRASVTGSTLGAAFATHVGALRSITIGASLGGVLALVGAQRRWWLLIPAALAAALSLSLAGHAADGAQPLGVGTDVLHLVAAATWIGVLAIATTLDAGPALRGISPIAAGAVGVLIATGIVQTLRDAGSFSALLTTRYGYLIDAKIALLVLLLALAFSARRALARGNFAIVRGIKAELWLLTAVIAVTAVLVESPLPRDAAEQRTVTATFTLNGFNVHVTATQIDDRRWSLRIDDLASLDGADLSASESQRHVGPLAIALARRGPGTFTGTIALPFAGAWTLLASVRSGAFDEAHVVLDLPVSAQ